MTYVLVSIAILSSFAPPGPSIQVQDQKTSLLEQRGLVADPGNGYTHFLKAADRIRLKGHGVIGDYVADGHKRPLLERAKAVVDALSACFTDVEKGLKLPVRDPRAETLKKWTLEDVEELHTFVEFGHLYSAQIQVSLAKGDSKHAANMLFQALEWSESFGHFSPEFYEFSLQMPTLVFHGLDSRCLSFSLTDAKRIEDVAAKLIAKPAPFRDLLYGTFWPSLSETRFRLLRLHMRICQFHWTHRRLPNDLNELKAPELVADPIAGSTFQYRPSGGIGYFLWSRGFGNVTEITLSSMLSPGGSP